MNIVGERNALSHRQEEDSVTCIRRRRAATQSDDDPGKRANDTNELPATVNTSTMSHLRHLHVDFSASSESSVPFRSQRSQTLSLGDYGTHNWNPS